MRFPSLRPGQGCSPRVHSAARPLAGELLGPHGDLWRSTCCLLGLLLVLGVLAQGSHVPFKCPHPLGKL